MCLTYFEKFPVKLNKKGVGIGWKVFRKNEDGSLSPELFGSNSIKYKTNKWIIANPKCVAEYFIPYKKMLQGYNPYFHIFLTRKDARIWRDNEYDVTIRKVKFRKMTVTGLQVFDCKFLRCIVAKEMLITNVKG